MLDTGVGVAAAVLLPAAAAVDAAAVDEVGELLADAVGEALDDEAGEVAADVPGEALDEVELEVSAVELGVAEALVPEAEVAAAGVDGWKALAPEAGLPPHPARIIAAATDRERTKIENIRLPIKNSWR